MTRRSNRAITYCVAGLIACLAADLGSKQWALDSLSTERPGERPAVCEVDAQGYPRWQRIRQEPVVLIEGYLELDYAENCGAAFGLLRDSPSWIRHTIFGLAASAAAIALMVMFVQGRGGPLFAWSVPFVVSGALGNLVDRLRLGYVVDFIRFHVHDSFEYPTFNVADIVIVIGVALLVLDGSKKPKEAKTAEAPAPEPKAEGGRKRRRKKRDDDAEAERA
ncbi:MAG: signal peptidase II [Sandaracinaceae bacterium]|nr:signal peptidase II [Sandaracinaceae bacterium]